MDFLPSTGQAWKTAVFVAVTIAVLGLLANNFPSVASAINA